MNDENSKLDTGLSKSKILKWYFRLYAGAILISILIDIVPEPSGVSAVRIGIGFLLLLVFFPMCIIPYGTMGNLWGIFGYLGYLSILIFMIKFRSNKKLVVRAFAVLVLLLMLNIYGCVTTGLSIIHQ